MPLPIYERYRPHCFAEVLGQPKVLKSLDTIRRVNGSLAGQAYLLYGPYGTGKTTIARLIMSEVCQPFYTEEVDGRTIKAETIERWETQCRYSVPGGYGYIINEAQSMRSDVVSRLQTTLETPAVQGMSTWAFTMPVDVVAFSRGKSDGAGFLSRVVDLHLTTQGLNPIIAARAQQIALELHLDGQPIAAYRKLVERCKNNWRKVLETILAGKMLEKGGAE